MVARTLLLPAALLAVVTGGFGYAIQQQSLDDSFNPIMIDPEVDRRINAYVPHVRELSTIPTYDPAARLEVRRAGLHWAQAYRAGKLKPLYQAYFAEDNTFGPHTEIFLASVRVIAGLERDAWLALNDRNRKQAIASARNAIDIANSLKYGDIDRLSYFQYKQERVLETLEEHPEWDSVPFAAKADLYRRTEMNRSNVSAMLGHLKTIYLQFHHRYAEVHPELPSPDDMMASVERVNVALRSDNPDYRQISRGLLELGQLQLSSDLNEPGPSYVRFARVDWTQNAMQASHFANGGIATK